MSDLEAALLKENTRLKDQVLIAQKRNELLAAEQENLLSQIQEFMKLDDSRQQTIVESHINPI